ncbi:CHAP domain-containing protein [Candidatus Collierbacteria bacterium]|nr:CHAP domain-containing protein [Candidatus Collierbacteria bacterium]
MNYVEFRDKWLGEGIDFDGSFGFQCMDVYRMYVKEVLGIPQSPAVAGAKNVWDTYLKEYFEKVANTPDGVPAQGDIVIWGHGKFGHIAICDHADKQYLTGFEQNWAEAGTAKDGKGVTELRKHNYANVLGWLVFKKDKDELKECLHKLFDVVIPEKEGLERALVEFKKTATEEKKLLEDGISDMEQKARAAETDRDQSREELKKLKEEDYQRMQSLAQKLLSRPDWPGIIAEIDKLLVVEDQKRAVEKELFAANEKIRGLADRVIALEGIIGASDVINVPIRTLETGKKVMFIWQKILKALKIR